MSNWIKNINWFQIIIILCMLIISMLLGIIIGKIIWTAPNNIELIASEQWGGAVPMQIYTVFDRDTGVYYAVTEKGGICVMQTMSGETKLVDQGDGTLIHKNKGEASDAA